ncbi:5931_t:CDS:2 [Dentiscutata erythropus]|uniref:5931_t:CDS:1 n=1 Tax=Dentiscutata erythropus TaxID=1348616 RepID=A0A9N9A491_9GLOM|nr:5931_t:CDS:2 [Dentiscutata erythropus]
MKLATILSEYKSYIKMWIEVMVVKPLLEFLNQKPKEVDIKIEKPSPDIQILWDRFIRNKGAKGFYMLYFQVSRHLKDNKSSPSQVTKIKRTSPQPEFDEIKAKVNIIHKNYIKNEKNPWIISVANKNINIIKKLYEKLTMERLQSMAFNNPFLSMILDLDIIDEFITECFTHDVLLNLSKINNINFLPSSTIKEYIERNTT